jgi:hypothetical protein
MPQRPWTMREVVQERAIFEDTRTVAKQSDGVLVSRLIQIEFSVDIAEQCPCGRQFVQQPAFLLPRLDSVLFAGKPVNDGDLHACLPDSIAQFGSQIPLDLFTR